METKVEIGNATLYLGDSRDILPTLEGIDATVTDPPYGLSFMGKRWDYDVPDEEIWAACLAAMKPGAHLLAFAGTRTQHRMAVRIEDAGFEIRDMIAWVYGSGFPKSLDVSKAIDKAAGAEREVTGTARGHVDTGGVHDDDNYIWKPVYERKDNPATDAAREWQGWGTALKPALEPITVARKPLSGTVAANVQEHGTGALNIDGCRVGTEQTITQEKRGSSGVGSAQKMRDHGYRPYRTDNRYQPQKINPPGRWPANFIHDGSDDVVALFPDTKSGGSLHERSTKKNLCYGEFSSTGRNTRRGPDTGSAARFFYCAKASKKDRGSDNPHPTVKPTDLMRYLCRLVTPPGGIVLDPFMGSGSTGKAAMLEGFRFIGIERDPHYFEIACRRIEDASKQARLV